jgi:hypothetical protein
MMRREWNVLLMLVFLVAIALVNGSTLEAAYQQKDVPASLKEWIPWVMHGHEDATCTFQYNTGSQYYCAWPSRLYLRLDPVKGEFRQEWHLQNSRWINLPGDQTIWPQTVMVNNQPVAVVDHNGRPAIKLQQGTHTVTGVLLWEKQPETLQVPPETGLVHLTLNGKKIQFPEFDAKGNLWLSGKDQKGTAADEEKNRLELRVYRNISDSIPLTITTRIDLDVSGVPREELLGWPLPPEYIPLSIASYLPVRLETDGRLRVQVRPGQWSVTLVARGLVPVNAITLTEVKETWPDEEIWVFDAQNHLRMVAIEGVSAIDSSQTSLPGEWQHLPAYRLRPGDTMQFVEKKRGDPDPAPDQLSLNRNIWLDEDGRGATTQDTITGTMSKGWRLAMEPPGVLGRVSVDGRDQLITKVADSKNTGVEVRRGQINLVADSRINKNISRLPAVGWANDFQKVNAALHLPPGWRLLEAVGVDSAPTWVKKWSLLDLFLVLIIFLAVARLYGILWGVVALLTMALTYHEPAAPRWVWLNLLGVVALLRVIPEGKVAFWFGRYRLVVLLFLIAFSIPFMMQQVRLGIFPQLEFNVAYQSYQQPLASAPAPDMVPEPMAVEESPGETDSGDMPRESIMKEEARLDSFEGKIKKRLKGNVVEGEGSYLGSGYYGASQQAGLLQYDTKARIQTGPGLPQWQWRTIPLNWNGPVAEGQQVRLILLSPVVNMVLAFLRVILLAGLILCFFQVKFSKGGGFSIGLFAGKVWVAAFLVLSLIAGSVGISRAELPSQEVLDQLRDRLLEKEDCLTQCADIPRMQLEVRKQQLEIVLDLHAYAKVAVPLPGKRKEWSPDQVLLDGKPATGLIRQSSGNLLLMVRPGRHKVLLSGPLPIYSIVHIDLPLKPHKVDVKKNGWEVEGIHEDGQVDNRLQLRRIHKAENAIKPFETGALPPFIRVERILRLGLEWEVETRVQRISPPGAPIILTVPLLEGESVVSDHIKIEKNQAMINLGPYDSEVYWKSVFEKREAFELSSEESTSWTEVWRLDASPVWHIETEGIPVIHHQDRSGYWQPEWRPWPGEAVKFTVTRPEGVVGPTVTVDSTSVEVRPGMRATDVKFDLTIRSSRGDQHTILLPEGAELQNVTINGKSQPIRQNDRSVTIPLTPGSQAVALSWRTQTGISFLFRIPEINLNIESVNSVIQLTMPRNRWILYAGGPRTGPAVLFWSQLIIILLVAVALGRVRLTPLKTRHWILLGIGLSQVDIGTAFVVVGWLLTLGYREKHGGRIDNNDAFDAVQVILAILTFVAFLALFHAIQRGLLGHPDMQIAGNGSNAYTLKWYQDRSWSILPQSWVVSVPLMVYRLAMLAWALWIAFALIKWLRWGWDCFSKDGLWRSVQHEKKKKGKVKKGTLAKEELVDLSDSMEIETDK